MLEEKFIMRNEARWKKLEYYNDTLSQKSVKALDIQQINEFADLFRAAGLHLAYAKTHYPNGQAVDYLNQLTGIAHQHFYLRQKGGWASTAQYVGKGFVRGIFSKHAYFMAAFLVFATGLLAGTILVAINREYAGLFLPESYIEAFSGDSAGLSPSGAGGVNYSFMSAYIMTNNINVALMSFAGGITFGLGTVYILFFNGALLGALSGLAATSGADIANFYSLILPHGFIELAAIFISGACGLIIGKSMLVPGDLKRKDSLIKGAKEAAYLVPGIAFMLVIAGLIEGFLTPLAIEPWVKLTFAFTTLTAMFLFYRRAAK